MNRFALLIMVSCCGAWCAELLGESATQASVQSPEWQIGDWWRFEQEVEVQIEAEGFQQGSRMPTADDTRYEVIAETSRTQEKSGSSYQVYVVDCDGRGTFQLTGRFLIAGLIPVLECAGKFLEIPGQSVWFEIYRCTLQNRGIVSEQFNKSPFIFVCDMSGIETCPDHGSVYIKSASRGKFENISNPSVGILHVVHRIFEILFFSQVDVKDEVAISFSHNEEISR